jgi:hypothetical protein
LIRRPHPAGFFLPDDRHPAGGPAKALGQAKTALARGGRSFHNPCVKPDAITT